MGVPEGGEREKGIETLCKEVKTSQIWEEIWPLRDRKLKDPQIDATQRDLH